MVEPVLDGAQVCEGAGRARGGRVPRRSPGRGGGAQDLRNIREALEDSIPVWGWGLWTVPGRGLQDREAEAGEQPRLQVGSPGQVGGQVGWRGGASAVPAYG